jgi:hypothetical protein
MWHRHSCLCLLFQNGYFGTGKSACATQSNKLDTFNLSTYFQDEFGISRKYERRLFDQLIPLATKTNSYSFLFSFSLRIGGRLS